MKDNSVLYDIRFFSLIFITFFTMVLIKQGNAQNTKQNDIHSDPVAIGQCGPDCHVVNEEYPWEWTNIYPEFPIIHPRVVRSTMISAFLPQDADTGKHPIYFYHLENFPINDAVIGSVLFYLEDYFKWCLNNPIEKVDGDDLWYEDRKPTLKGFAEYMRTEWLRSGN